MDDLITALDQKDFVKVKSIFNECMKTKVEKVLAERKIEICQNVMIEGEEKTTEDDDEDDEDSEDEDDEDE